MECHLGSGAVANVDLNISHFLREPEIVLAGFSAPPPPVPHSLLCIFVRFSFCGDVVIALVASGKALGEKRGLLLFFSSPCSHSSIAPHFVSVRAHRLRTGSAQVVVGGYVGEGCFLPSHLATVAYPYPLPAACPTSLPAHDLSTIQGTGDASGR